ncbi:hypothetical protein VPG91_11495 [Nitrospirillum amazonense]|uniref:hypothetical protein n=1 Tax=Nitrospirillum amazonense TaxID=28077 RepID=UPI002DD447F5|nr:hypothetical protein [Nitrospirillum amazonense]MEC4591613.1 hypothetical protein [Nitrospirillum amazonense]
MATITIGGQAHDVPVLNFAALKAAWADIKSMPSLTDPVEQASTAIRIVAAALKSTMPEMTVEAIEQKLAATEFPAVIGAVVDILREAGLVGSGEPAPQTSTSTT